MTLDQNINLICFLIFLIYWVIFARSVKPTKEIKNSLWNFRIVVLVIVVLIWTLNSFGIYKTFPIIFIVFIPHLAIISILSIFFSVVGLIIVIVARKTLGGNWSRNIDIKEHHELITHGIYKYMRHPIYTGFIFLLLGMTLSQKTIEVAVISILTTLFLLYKLFQEEKLMTKYFPKQYTIYKMKTKRLIPFVW